MTEDLRETIAAAYDAAQTETDEAEGETIEHEAPEEESAVETASEPAEEPAEAPSDDEPAGGEESEEIAASDVERDEDTEGEAQAVQPPEHWSDEQKQKFDAIPDEHKAMILETRRSVESAFEEKSQALAAQRRLSDEVTEILRPHQHLLDQAGLDAAGGVRALVAKHNAITQQPGVQIPVLVRDIGSQLDEGSRRKLVRDVATALGVDAGGPLQDQADEEFLDPAAAQRMGHLEQKLDAIAQGQTSQQQASQQAQQAQMTQQLEQFRDEKDASGNLLRPHFNEVMPTMGALIQGGQADTLQSAYDMAAYANPQVRERVISSNNAAASKRVEADRKENLAKSKKAARKVKSSGGAGDVSKQTPVSRREAVEQAYEAIQSRG